VERLHNGKSSGRYHAGIDHRAGAGTPIRAAGDGVVRMARMWRLPGGTVGIDHGQGVVTMYMHQARFAVKPGQPVKAGQVIGYVGMTGFATGPHLHWSLYVHGVPVNAAEWTSGMQTCTSRAN
jgi:murein DD-endopeptidase MepM/ murein hydrolase activator NlpD